VSPRSKGRKKGRARQARQAGAQQIRAPEGAEILDPANPDGRSRITDLWLGERQIPRDRWASYRTLVDQLWAGDPPEMAEQATRMAAGGLDRDVIYHKPIKDTSIRA